MKRAMSGIENIQEVDPIDRMLEMYVDLADATNEETVAEINVASAAAGIRDWYSGRDATILGDDFERLGKLHFDKAQIEKVRSGANNQKSHFRHELFDFVHQNLLGKLVSVEMLDGQDSIVALGYTTKHSYTPELVVKGYETKVKGRIDLPPLDGRLVLNLKPSKGIKPKTRRTYLYEVPIVGKDGVILADVRAED